MSVFLCFLFLLLSSATACQRCVRQTKVSYFSKDSVLSSGACGYGSLALGFSGGFLAAGVPSLYKDGAGCGACFQMRCKNKALCSRKGTKFILSDITHNNKTDFVLSRKAFMAMANRGMGKDILKHRVLDVEYKRIPCEYKNHNLSLRVEESSKKPDHLAVKLLYQGGQTEIVRIVVYQVGATFPIDMSRKSGAIWETKSAPKEASRFGFVVLEGGFDPRWHWADYTVLPVDWKPGMIYDTGVRINDIIQEGCPESECDPQIWK
ncbi:Expansin-like [Melia azedarach]|uniref:Expansin-like n=1 Tax=Melia azedarach TaxID=155640 RepID=A0ACC1XY67_MELAZ|nr:Expansin-like [Melia azedarach]